LIFKDNTYKNKREKNLHKFTYLLFIFRIILVLCFQYLLCFCKTVWIEHIIPDEDFDFDFWCFSATFSNISAISWRPVLVLEEAKVPGENHRPWASNW
jgi:hypothetical protein